jgi:hypothetical protein
MVEGFLPKASRGADVVQTSGRKAFNRKERKEKPRRAQRQSHETN